MIIILIIFNVLGLCEISSKKLIIAKNKDDREKGRGFPRDRTRNPRRGIRSVVSRGMYKLGRIYVPIIYSIYLK